MSLKIYGEKSLNICCLQAKYFAFSMFCVIFANKNRINGNTKHVKLKNKNIMAYVISDDCIACGTCIDECPVGAISEGDKYVINADACTECGTCASVCPSEAISLPE